MLRIYIEEGPDKKRIKEACSLAAIFADREGCYFLDDPGGLEMQVVSEASLRYDVDEGGILVYKDDGIDYLEERDFCNGEGLDLAVFTLKKAEDADKIIHFQKRFRQTAILLLIRSAPPLEAWLQPEMQIFWVLRLPVDEDILRASIERMIRCIVRNRQREVGHSSYLVRFKGMDYCVPYYRIHYFEAKDKLINLYYDHGKLSFYDTLKAIGDHLPENFIQCHRSYIVNGSHVRKIDRIQNQILLEAGECIPLSVRYKKRLYAAMQR